MRLPSTRDLAEQLAISRTVVLLAYEQLLAEGFVEGRQGSGTYVSAGLQPAHPVGAEADVRPRLTRFAAHAAHGMSRLRSPTRQSTLPYDFAYGRTDLDTFPFEHWRRILMRCARRATVTQLDYGAASGSGRLREAISAHVRRARAVRCDPSQVIVVNGSQQGLDLIARVLIEPGTRAVIEDPCYQGMRELLRASGARLCPVPVDRGGLDTAKLPARAQIAFVTPSHQFPTGAVLSLHRRLALLKWARQNQAAIVEDDFDGEFRYDGQPLESLQGLDAGQRVIYVGTFSRTLFPSLRIGYLIAPVSLLTPFTYVKWLSDRQTASLEQHALADLIESGAYERYLRRVRRRNAQRRRALLEAIDKYLNGTVEVTGDASGAHVVLWPARALSEQDLVAAAASRGVGVYGVSGYYLKRPPRAGILLGYNRLTESQIREGVRRLSKCL
jgi:GntR family transcriptional regulator / MocR family aminotransferase